MDVPVGELVDVLARIGPAHGPASGWPLETVLAEQERNGIRWSLVHHQTALNGSPEVGNSDLLRITRERPSLLPIAVVRPLSSTGAADEVTRLTREGVRGFWVGDRPVQVTGDRVRHTGGGSRGFRATAVRRLLREVAAAGRPILVPLEGWGDASEIGAATADLGVPIILVGAHYDHVVDDLAAAEEFEHLHLETSGLVHIEAVGTAVRRLGATRILFGSGLPNRSARSVIHAIASAGVSPADRDAIFSGNARRLFDLRAGEVPVVPLDAPERLVDVHTHFTPGTWDMPPIADHELLPRLGAIGARAIVTSSITAIMADTEAGNAQTVAASSASSGQLGLLVADPNEPETVRDHLRRWGEAPGIVGVKVHGVWSDTPTDSARMRRLFGILAGYGRPVKIHNAGEGWAQALQELSELHPRLPILIAHGGPGAPVLDAASLTTRADNVYVELCSSRASLPVIREFVRTVRIDRLVFGSDAPVLDPSYVRGLYLDADIPVAKRAHVFEENAMELFGIPASAGA